MNGKLQSTDLVRSMEKKVVTQVLPENIKLETKSI